MHYRHATEKGTVMKLYRATLLSLGVSVGLLTGIGCSERQVEPDYSEIIRDTCELGCSYTLECGINDLYDDWDECVQGCTSSDVWDDLNQCDSRSIALTQCESELTCEELALWADPLDPNGSLKEGLPCGDVALEWYSCDPNEPFDPPE
jgi:hypothetical protein